jgi:solute carrier family 50 protein (sugar transporter)
MSAHATAVFVAKVLTMITTLLMRVSLLLLFVNCYAVMFYAISIDDMLPLFATSILGIVTGVFFNYFFYRWTAHKRSVLQIFVVAFAVCVTITTYCVLAICGLTGQSHASVNTTMGFMTIGTTVGMYMSPMATIVRVIRTKTASSMPFTMGIVNVLNSFCWALYSGLVGNMFILAPNIAGLALGLTQLILTYIYRRTPSLDHFSASLDDPYDQAELSVVVVSPVQDGGKLSGVGGLKSPSFVAMHTPNLSN